MHALRLHPILETLYRDRQNMFDVTMFRYRVHFSFILLLLLIAGAKNVVRYTEDFVIERFGISRFYCSYQFSPQYWYQRTCHIHVREWFKFLEAKIG